LTRLQAGEPRNRSLITGRPVLGPTQYLPGDLSPVVKQSGREADN